MATFNELAQRYAQRILAAISQDGFSKIHKNYCIVFIGLTNNSKLKSVKSDIDSLVYTESQKPLSESDKTRIIVEIQKELHLPSQRQMEMIF